MTREELLELSRLVSGELSAETTADAKSRVSGDPPLAQALRRLERLSELTAAPVADDFAAATRAIAAIEPRKSVLPRVLGVVVLVGVIASLELIFVERVQSTVEHVQRDLGIDAGVASAKKTARRFTGDGRIELMNVELEAQGEFWWAEIPGVEPLSEASHVTQDNPSLESLPMKTFATPRQTVLAVWIISGTVSAAAPVPKPEITSPEDAGVVLTVLTDEKHTIPIEPGDEVGFEPSTLGTAWELGTRNAIFFTRGEGRGAVVVWHTDGGVDRIPVNSTATPTTGEHRTTVFLGTPTIIHLHDVVRWDVGDASILTVTRDGLAFSLKGLRVGSTSFRAWDGEGRMGVWNVAVLDSENQPIRIVVGMSKLVQMPDMLRADVDGDAATATLIGPRNLQLTARKEGAATVTIALKDGSTKRRTVIVGPLPTQGPVREIALPEDGGRIDVRVGETVSIQVPALKRFEQRGDVSPVDVRGTTLMIRPERRGDTTFTVETHTSSASRKFTIEAR